MSSLEPIYLRPLQEQQGRPLMLVQHHGEDKVKMEIKPKPAQRTGFTQS